jgi:hypothetical protein
MRVLFLEGGEVKINGPSGIRKIVLYFFHPLQLYKSIHFKIRRDNWWIRLEYRQNINSALKWQ